MDDFISKSKKHIQDKLNIPQITDFLLVSTQNQKLYLINNLSVTSSYLVSTSKYGNGNMNDSFQTPLGIHHIAKKIGEGLKKNTILKGRKPVFNGITTDDLESGKYDDFKNNHFSNYDDVITSRIMWLKGNEKDYNLGGEVDSYNRYIYIHGTYHEKDLGSKASHGCIRMSNEDVISLFDLVNTNTLVYIM